jgi:transcriptional regulator of aromatic amino acid metabolism
MVASTSLAGSVSLPDCLVRLLRALPEPAICVSAAGEILLANRAARDALDLNAERPVQCALADLLDSSYPSGPGRRSIPQRAG